MNSDIIKRPDIKTNEITLSNHYLKRFKERLPDAKDARKYSVDAIVGGSYCGITSDEEGKYAHCFMNNGFLLYLDLDLRTLKTIYTTDERSAKLVEVNEQQKQFSSKVKDLYSTEIRKLDRSFNALKKRIEEFNLHSAVEHAQLQLRIHKTKSKSVKLSCEARMTAIHLTRMAYESELKEIERSKVKTIKGLNSIGEYIL